MKRYRAGLRNRSDTKIAHAHTVRSDVEADSEAAIEKLIV